MLRVQNPVSDHFRKGRISRVVSPLTAKPVVLAMRSVADVNPQSQIPQSPKRERDLRLDFFRGLAMIVILFAHITDNPWNLWMPGRFGFSDATEVFVFCSGIATALAFGAVFTRAGFLIGTARILYRLWQVYWVHLGIFFVALFAMLLLNYSQLFPRDEVGALNLYPFLRNTGQNFFGLMTLTYVPNYFDVLPMYLVLLALVPVMLGLAKIDFRLALLASVALWVVATTGGLKLPAEYWFPNGSTRGWFFNPFAWQLLFFTGFALASGWLPKPVIRQEFVILAVIVVVVSLPFAYYRIIGAFDDLQAWRRDYWYLYDKTRFGVLRYGYFLALAYLAWALCGEKGVKLKALKERFPKPVGMVVKIGSQSLAVFAASMVLARILGAVMNAFGYHNLVVFGINLMGLGLIWLVAVTTSWFKSASWKTKGKEAAPEAATPEMTKLPLKKLPLKKLHAAEVKA